MNDARYYAVVGDKLLMDDELKPLVQELRSMGARGAKPEDVAIYLRNGGARYAEKMSADAYSEAGPSTREWRLRPTEGAPLVVVVRGRMFVFHDGNFMSLATQSVHAASGPISRAFGPAQVRVYQENDGELFEVDADEYSVACETGARRWLP